jgi:hypothetical protein
MVLLLKQVHLQKDAGARDSRVRRLEWLLSTRSFWYYLQSALVMVMSKRRLISAWSIGYDFRINMVYIS